MRQLYAGCDLHGNNNFIGIVDGKGKRVFKKRLSNDLSLVRDTLEPFHGDLVGGRPAGSGLQSCNLLFNIDPWPVSQEFTIQERSIMSSCAATQGKPSSSITETGLAFTSCFRRGSSGSGIVSMPSAS